MSNVKWQETANGCKASIGEGAFKLTIYYDNGWRVLINDRRVKHEYPDIETAKRVAVNWAKEKLIIIRSELDKLERS